MSRCSEKTLLNAILKRRPFLPFSLELLSGSCIEVNHPEALTLHDKYIVFASTRGIKSVFEYGALVRFIDVTT
jgi:hypothetical protein